MKTTTLAIEEMSCAACVRHVTEALQRVDGAVVSDVRVGSATVCYDPSKTSPQAMISVLAGAGYPAQPTVESAEDH